jgi:hypothetical protein
VRKSSLAALFLGAAALTGCPQEPNPPSNQPGWSVVLDDKTLKGVVLSVWGADPSHVFVAGGPLGNSGYSTVAMRWDGASWKDLSPGGTETFWWVSGTSVNDVWFVGEKGRLAHFDGSGFKEMASGVTATLWGVFALGPNDVWSVGGTPDSGTNAPNDIVLHYDGSAWKQEMLPGKPLGVSLFKVWGTSSDDLYVVGELGTIWHRTAAGWTFEGGNPPLVKSRLFTVSGCAADDVFAVGGSSVIHRDASGWSKVTIDLGNQVNGVACGPKGSAVIVGFGGLKQRLSGGQWIDEFDKEPYSDLHAAWADGQGAFWAVGGDFLTPAKPDTLRKGVVARYLPETAK